MNYSEKDLSDEGVRQWEWIKEDYTDSPILLGNGFSLNFATTLAYKQLFEMFKPEASDKALRLFDEFHTTNFEIVLQHLESTEKVLDAIEQVKSEVPDLKKEIRHGLVHAIYGIHPTPKQIDQTLIKYVASQFQNFTNIFTTNYDLFLYYITMEISKSEKKKFGDYFYYKYHQDNKFQQFNAGDEINQFHTYYLHGALFIFEKGVENVKIKRQDDWLISQVVYEIEQGNYPLYVSEGSSESKLMAIQSNPYLSYCFSSLKSSKETSIVVFGQSLNAQDDHLVKALDNHFKKIAVSIKPDHYLSLKEIGAERSRLQALFKKAEVQFYDSNGLFSFKYNYWDTGMIKLGLGR